MSLARGKFGIEYNPRPPRDDSGALVPIVILVALAALVSLTWTLVRRFRAAREEPSRAAVVAETPPVASPAAGPSAVPRAASQPPPPPPPPPQQPAFMDSLMKRPVKVRTLLMRLEEAEKTRDVNLAVSTIEQIRDLPGAPAADLDDALARRLGVLNVRRLFLLRNPQWVTKHVVRGGESASRIAIEHGSTLASMVRLNGAPLDRLVAGSSVYVMNHPRFNLVVRRRARTADLQLNGKFFKRYDLTGPVAAKEGPYETTPSMRTFWSTLGIRLKNDDRAELEMLLPRKSPVLVSEM